MAAVDNLVERRRSREHRLRLGGEFSARGDVRQMQARKRLAGALMGPGECFPQSRQIGCRHCRCDRLGNSFGVKAFRELFGSLLYGAGAQTLLVAQHARGGGLQVCSLRSTRGEGAFRLRTTPKVASSLRTYQVMSISHQRNPCRALLGHA